MKIHAPARSPDSVSCPACVRRGSTVVGGWLLTVALLAPVAAWAADTNATERGAVYELRDLTVSPEPGASRLPDASTTATVLDATALQDAGAEHLQQALALVPNLTAAGGTSRPRYYQIRGIGERSQFAGEGPPNFSVGFLVDDMDLSGLGMHASLFDVDEVEVLRGPQAAIYGSKALAGLIHVHTADPSPVPEGRARVTVGTDALAGFGAAVGGPVGSSPSALTTRFSVEHMEMNGFRDNAYLGRDDTNARDEWTVRSKWRWEPDEEMRWDLLGLWSRYDNGYDEFMPDNNGFTTYADRPGRDRQETVGGSLRSTWMQPEPFRVLSITTYTVTDVDYGYDADWGNDAFWAAPPYDWDPAREGYAYDFTESLSRRRGNASQDLRVISEPGGEVLWGSSAWHVGAYASHLSEDDDYTGFGTLGSEYRATSGALYGELGTRVADATVLRTSWRGEERATDYEDDQQVNFDGDDTMWGGRVALEHKLDREVLAFAGVSRGFKGGGVNQNPALPPERRAYDPETLWCADTGTKGRFFDGRTTAALTLFYMWREDLQIGTSAQGDPSDPTAFVYFTDNAASGYNYGLESEVAQQLTSWWQVFGNVSLLESEFRNYESADGSGSLDGREQPYAPAYSYLAGTQVRLPVGCFARAEVEGKDAFYLGDGHDQRSEPYEVVNAQLGYGHGAWTLTLWGRNVFDKRYITRGYYFGLEPPAFADELYVTYGDPAQFGATLDVVF